MESEASKPNMYISMGKHQLARLTPPLDLFDAHVPAGVRGLQKNLLGFREEDVFSDGLFAVLSSLQPGLRFIVAEGSRRGAPYNRTCEDT